MALVVLKFGGTSLANTKLMKNAVARVIEQVNLGNKVVVVVSAMAGVTDHLVGLANEVAVCKTQDNWAEYANVVTAGEQISAGLFSLFLQEEGIKARSWLSWQVGIITDDNLKDSEVVSIECQKLLSSFEEGYKVAVVAGFQGITCNQRNSTLGRGGSDTSAIILAGHLKAKICDIYTDVEGVFTGDPRIVAKAHKIDYISYDQMIVFANSGAKILQEKSVKWAKHFNVKVHVLSSFTGNPGTIISNFAPEKLILGVSLSNQIITKFDNKMVAKVSIIGENIEKNNKLIIKLRSFLEKAKINIFSFESSSLVISFIVEEDVKFDAVRLLHQVCELD